MSQESKYTPGPWSIGASEKSIPGYTPINAPGHYGLAQVATQMDGGNTHLDEIKLSANARLIAAAPALLTALKGLSAIGYLDDSSCASKEGAAALRAARAAISLAELAA